ncbi:D-alanine--D-alanine ligase [Asaia krungthepensis]|uniref:D-alanine--D-alanine ligase n=1 Tax=Asaia krungthepensis NRIC 0535 TaxID=1307925 RepID=A0ABQ0PX55_9PROT|nr:D-alanine--D-alanine ligase [Asaia krungthepensis]GBQ83809.1 D-alanine--D-alanine ligase [Asaia krungthepensis NRIC 0535]
MLQTIHSSHDDKIGAPEALPTVSGQGETQEKAPHPLSLFEFWPGSIFYTPIVLYWIGMGLRYGDFSVPSAANPLIETGGLCGESKSGILDLAGPVAKAWIAPYVTQMLRKNRREDDARELMRAMAEKQIGFPVVIKPDIGCNGTGVKLVRSKDQVLPVLREFPSGVRILAQALAEGPVEAGLFYIREPGAREGRITSITYKEAPVMTGDGVATIRELIARDARTNLLPDIYLPRLRDRLDTIPELGEQVQLVFTGNHCKGSIFRDGRKDATPALCARLDEIIGDVTEFHFGRIDVKAASVEELRRGENFEIIELNGVGSEATHIWDSRTTLWEAYRAQFYHYRAAFRIGAMNRARGWKTCGAYTMLRYWRKQRRLLALYPLND